MKKTIKLIFTFFSILISNFALAQISALPQDINNTIFSGSSPTSLNYSDLKVTTAGKCRVRTPNGYVVYKYPKSPCEKFFGKIRSSSTTTSSSGSVYGNSYNTSND